MKRWRRATAIKVGAGVAAAVLAIALLVPSVAQLRATRQGVLVYARLIAAANAKDLATIRSLCTERYLVAHPLRVAGQGGVAGLPRQIHPNYQVWVEGSEVWLCQGNRMGVVVRFVRVRDQWRYDGEVGILRADGQIVQPEADDLESDGEKP